MATTPRGEREHDKTIEDSFPASDPPANSGITGAESEEKPGKRPIEERPAGTPASEGHAAETAHQREDQTHAPKR